MYEVSAHCLKSYYSHMDREKSLTLQEIEVMILYLLMTVCLNFLHEVGPSQFIFHSNI